MRTTESFQEHALPVDLELALLDEPEFLDAKCRIENQPGIVVESHEAVVRRRHDVFVGALVLVEPVDKIGEPPRVLLEPLEHVL